MDWERLSGLLLKEIIEMQNAEQDWLKDCAEDGVSRFDAEMGALPYDITRHILESLRDVVDGINQSK